MASSGSSEISIHICCFSDSSFLFCSIRFTLVWMTDSSLYFHLSVLPITYTHLLKCEMFCFHLSARSQKTERLCKLSITHCGNSDLALLQSQIWEAKFRVVTVKAQEIILPWAVEVLEKFVYLCLRLSALICKRKTMITCPPPLWSFMTKCESTGQILYLVPDT